MEDVGTESSVAVDGLPLPRHLYDGYLVHRDAISRGLDVLLLPRQVLLAGVDSAVPAKLSFTHGVPQSSTLSAVTFAQDRRLRRALFERRGVAKPTGASFSHRSLGRATRWAKSKGFPVSVKEAIGENDGRAIRHVNSPRELDEAFTTLRVREESDRAPGSNPNISGYTTTRLTYVVDDQGRELAPTRTRMLIEKEPVGKAFRTFVVDGEVVGIVELSADGEVGEVVIIDTANPGLTSAATNAADAVPGLGFAMVDLTETRGRNPLRKPRYLVTELSERPRMASLSEKHPHLAERVAQRLLQAEARRGGVPLHDPVSVVKRTIRVDGLRDPENAAAQAGDTYRAHGAQLDLKDVDPVMGSFMAVCEGPVALVAALNEMLMSGDLIDDRAAAIEYVRENEGD